MSKPISFDGAGIVAIGPRQTRKPNQSKLHRGSVQASAQSYASRGWHYSWGASKDTLLMAYPAMIRSIIDYASIAYDNTSSTNRATLDSVL